MSFSLCLISLLAISNALYNPPQNAPAQLPQLRDISPVLLRDLIRDVRHRIDEFQRPVDTQRTPPEQRTLIAGLVRLAILDCVGGCNGCMDPNVDKLGGVEFATVLPIEQLYQNKRRIKLPLSALPSDIGKFRIYDTINVKNDNWNGNPSGRNWNNKYYGISRADIWMLAATIGIEYGVEIAYINSGKKLKPRRYKNACIKRYRGEGIELDYRHYYRNHYHYSKKIDCVDIPYYIGRKDCPTSPWVNADLVTIIFQNNPFFNFNELNAFFSAGFGFTRAQQTVAFMGAHTLGRGHQARNRSKIDENLHCCGGSGFRGAWKIPTAAFSNVYYKQMRDGYHILAPTNTKRNPFDTIFNKFTSELSWLNARNMGNNLVGFNLNVDMCLYLDIDPEEGTGKVDCLHPKIFDEIQRGPPFRQVIELLVPNKTLPKCSRTASAQKFFDIYAKDNIRFLYDFIGVWEIMISSGALRPQLPGYNRYYFKTSENEKNQGKGKSNDFVIFMVILGISIFMFVLSLVILVRYCYLKRKDVKNDKEQEMANVVATKIDPIETDGQTSHKI